MVDLFCKTTINEIMPSVRSLVATRMAEKGFTQKQIALMLNMSQPAISQYKKRVRGTFLSRIYRNKEMLAYIDGMISEIQGGLDLNMKVCNICKKARVTGAVKPAKTEPFLCLLEMAGSERK